MDFFNGLEYGRWMSNVRITINKVRHRTEPDVSLNRKIFFQTLSKCLCRKMRDVIRICYRSSRNINALLAEYGSEGIFRKNYSAISFFRGVLQCSRWMQSYINFLIGRIGHVVLVFLSINWLGHEVEWLCTNSWVASVTLPRIVFSNHSGS